MRDRAHDDAMAEAYRDDPAFAAEMLNSILEDGDQGELLIALRQMAKAFGGVQAIAEQAHLNPTQLYRTLSPDGNPALSNFSAILKAMGDAPFRSTYAAPIGTCLREMMGKGGNRIHPLNKLPCPDRSIHGAGMREVCGVENAVPIMYGLCTSSSAEIKGLAFLSSG